MVDIEEISDDVAVGVVDKVTRNVNIATKFVERTILYPVKVKTSGGGEEIEIRTFVRQAEYCSPARWEQALEVEKKYPKLNKKYSDALVKAGKPVSIKEPGNPLKITLLEGQ